MTDVNTAKEAAAEVLAVLDKAGANQLGQILSAIYGDELMTRVVARANQDTENKRPAAIVNALDRIVNEDASRHPNPLQSLGRNESVELGLKLHELNKSLNPALRQRIEASHVKIPFLSRSSAVHTPVARNLSHFHSI